MKPLITFGFILIAALFVAAVFAPFIATHDHTAINIKEAYLPPSASHIFGTDSLGRDLFSRMVYASRVVLMTGFVAVGIAAVIGVVLGSFSGYFGGAIDSVIMRFTDMMLCFPVFFLILSVVAFVTPGILNIMVIIGCTSWMGIARLIRAEVLTLRTKDYVLAAKALGRSNVYIVFRHIIPNGLGPALVNFVFGIAGAILVESALSFLGLGIQPPDPSWGNILLEGKSGMGVAWWVSVFPGLAIFFTAFGFNMLGEGLKQFFNPRLKR